MWLVPQRTRRNTLAPWSPFSAFDGEIERWFESATRDFGVARRDWAPAMDVTETEEAYLVEADVPGLKKEDIKIEVLDNVLTIKGERKTEDEKEEKGYHRVERHYGSFHRTIEVPGGFVEDKITANFKDGVLKVTLPKREEAKAKVIEVRAK